MNKQRRLKIERNKADKQWAQAVRARDKVCQICGSDKNLNSHHVLPRTLLDTRWDVRNGITLCVGCHKFGPRSAHKNGFWFANWLMQHRFDTFEYLRSKL